MQHDAFKARSAAQGSILATHTLQMIYPAFTLKGASLKYVLSKSSENKLINI